MTAIQAIVVTQGPNRGKQFRLVAGKSYDVGSAPDCLIPLDDPGCAPIHALLEWRDDGWWVRERETALGTLLNGERHADRPLAVGDVVRLGQTALQMAGRKPSSISSINIQVPPAAPQAPPSPSPSDQAEPFADVTRTHADGDLPTIHDLTIPPASESPQPDAAVKPPEPAGSNPSWSSFDDLASFFDTTSSGETTADERTAPRPVPSSTSSLPPAAPAPSPSLSELWEEGESAAPSESAPPAQVPRKAPDQPIASLGELADFFGSVPDLPDPKLNDESLDDWFTGDPPAPTADLPPMVEPEPELFDRTAPEPTGISPPAPVTSKDEATELSLEEEPDDEPLADAVSEPVIEPEELVSLADAPADSVARIFLSEPYNFDFFQGMRILERMYPDRSPVGRAVAPDREVVRFQSHLSVAFPPSQIMALRPNENPDKPPTMEVTFLGLTGPSGVLPRHYTETALRIERESKDVEKSAYRDWLSLFDHRMISLFYRAWEKYRFNVPFERAQRLGRDAVETDPFSQSLFCLIGFGMESLRDRIKLVTEAEPEHADPEDSFLHVSTEVVLARINDLSLLYYAGMLAQRPRNVFGLKTLVEHYFQVKVTVRQFQGRWLELDEEDVSRLSAGHNNQLGVSFLAGTRIWDTESKFRLRVGPLRYQRFCEFLPDRTPIPDRKSLFLLTHLVRLYVGMEFDFDVQLVLRKAEVPSFRLAEPSSAFPLGSRLGWNTWTWSQPFSRDADEVFIDGDDPTRF